MQTTPENDRETREVTVISLSRKLFQKSCLMRSCGTNFRYRAAERSSAVPLQRPPEFADPSPGHLPVQCPRPRFGAPAADLEVPP